MKRFFQLLSITLLPIIFAFVFFIMVGFIQPEIKIKYNGETILLNDSKPIYYNNEQLSTILVPIDIIAQRMGDKLAIDYDNKILTIKSDKYVISFIDKSRNVYVNNVMKKSPVEVTFKDEHVYAPLRFFCDSLGRNVYWNSTTTTINIFDSHGKDFSDYLYASDFVSVKNFKMQPNKVFFYNNDSSYKLKPNYLPGQLLNPSINKQLYSITNAIVDPLYYTYIDYISDDVYPHALISVNEKSEFNDNPDNYFKFKFYDKKYANLKKDFSPELSPNAVIKLELNNLKLRGVSSKLESNAILTGRLKLSLISLFGENTGINISDYITYEYSRLIEDSENNEVNYKKVRRFDNIRVDLLYNYEGLSKDTLHIYFTFRP